MEEDDDLYGAPGETIQEPQASTSQLRARSEDTEIVDYEPDFQAEPDGQALQDTEAVVGTEAVADAEVDPDQVADDDEGSDSDVEIITDRPAMSLDNRGNKGPVPSVPPLQAQTTSSSLTTEYTPQRRRPDNGNPLDGAVAIPQIPVEVPAIEDSNGLGPGPGPEASDAPLIHPKLDTSLLPPALAPSTHPSIDPTIPGVYDGRLIFDHDMDTFTEKPWRRPGSNISDWFNYGFDEISWEAYCYRRRQLGEDANILRANVINFSGLADHEVTSLPPEVRSMVMTGTTTLMHNQQVNGMMGMNPIMGDMSSIQIPMGMTSMPVVAGEYGPVIPQGGDSGEGTQSVGDGIGYASNTQQTPSGEYTNQTEQMPEGNAGGSGLSPAPGSVGRGTPYGAGFRGRGAAQPPQPPARPRGGFRGRGAPPQGPARSTSPLPPNVPTGPRNQTRYKDRDGPAGASDGLDYGSNHKDPHYGYHEDERNRSRKRRASPRLEEYSRSSKRR